MRWQIWRTAAIVLAALGLGLMVANVVAPSGSWGFDGVRGARPGVYRVIRLTPGRDIHPDLRVGDVISLRDHSLTQRLRFLRSRPGDTFVFDRVHGSPVTVRFVTQPDQVANWIFTPICLAFIAMGTLLALRRPRQGEVRALAAVLLIFGFLMTIGVQAWMPTGIVMLALLVVFPVQMAGLAGAIELATTFPDPQARGARRIIRWSNYVMSPLFAALGVWAVVTGAISERALPQWATIAGSYPWVYYVVAITAAFWIANVRAQGADRWRVRWVSVAVGVAFSGIVAELALIVVGHVHGEWVGYLPLTMIAMPFGLGYAIVRHRVVDIGFVVNRALVFGIVSAVVIVAFIVLEWALSTVFVKFSHVTSATLELMLALVLGFSLRGIHSRVDAFIDDLFFRSRHENERALKTLAREVAYVTDPRVALARTHAELVARTGASGAAVYVVTGPDALRVDPAASAAPDRVDVDDPALVRMRATRLPVALAGVASALAGDHAFPMCVRDSVTGALVLGAKTNGEAYAPDELATIETVVLALGNALDALQTAALKAEIARVLLDGAPVETLRRTVDAAAWVRGVVSS
ncbi:MAG TPA: hypothetical protein VGU66_19810 [Candidatus Elarobacter sp.]|nr:hypothetical protein [Candidatus Elarobacter sp.]